jgi:hypothetical protein
VVQPAAVLGLTEAFLDTGPVAEPRFQGDVGPGVGGDVGDEKADRPDMISGAAQRQGELVLGDRTPSPRPRVLTELVEGDLDPADDRLSDKIRRPVQRPSAT